MDKPTPSPYATLIYSKTCQLKINCIYIIFLKTFFNEKNQSKAAHEVLIMICLALSCSEEALASFSDFW